MNHKKASVLVLLLLLCLIVQAHEFWLLPGKFFFQVGETATISFKVGENFVGEPWDLKKHKIEKLEVHHNTTSIDLRANVKEGVRDNLEILLKEEGTHLVVMESNAAFIELESEKFNQYLKEDGLDEAYDHRVKTKTLDKSAREFYSRHAKLLLQSGSKRDDVFRKVVGMPLEIVPETNPYAVQKGEMIRFKILWQGKPLFGARVKVWNKLDNRTAIQNIYTQQNGMIETRISNSGQWMISVVKIVPSKEEGADWRSYWGSLVFGVN